MICDTIDAMTTARPYRDPLPVSVVREELRKHSGSQFDSQIVDVVLNSALLDRLEIRTVPPNRSGSTLHDGQSVGGPDVRTVS